MSTKVTNGGLSNVEDTSPSNVRSPDNFKAVRFRDNLFPASPPQDASQKRRKAVRASSRELPEYSLLNAIFDIPAPSEILDKVHHVAPPDRDEYTHIRYSAVACDPIVVRAHDVYATSSY